MRRKQGIIVKIRSKKLGRSTENLDWLYGSIKQLIVKLGNRSLTKGYKKERFATKTWIKLVRPVDPEHFDRFMICAKRLIDGGFIKVSSRRV